MFSNVVKGDSDRHPLSHPERVYQDAAAHPALPDDTPVHAGTTKLRASLSDDQDTQRFRPITTVVPASHWGTTRVKKVVELTIHAGSDTHVLRVSCCGTLVLGRSNVPVEDAPFMDLTPYDAYVRGVSRRHASLRTEDGMLSLRDLDSTNGTYLNGLWLPPFQSRILRDGDMVMLDQLRMDVRFV